MFATQLTRMKGKQWWSVLILLAGAYWLSMLGSGCAQIGSPTGGPRDSTAPKLVMANPPNYTTQFKGNKVVFTFNEYIDVKDIQNNLIASPFPKITPQVDFKLKTVTLKIKDTLQPNTTYAFNFGDAVRDNNEGNPYRNLTYVFSTGNTIDSLELYGSVSLAETGKVDTTLLVSLYRNAPDSAVKTRKPDYMARLNGTGHFRFRYLAPGTYKLYALKDADGGKTYNSTYETFAFLNDSLVLKPVMDSVQLLAYEAEKDPKTSGASNAAAAAKAAAADKKLRYSTSLIDYPKQDLDRPFELRFNHPLKTADLSKIILADTSGKSIASALVKLDSTAQIISIKAPWAMDEGYQIFLPKEAVSDSAGTMPTKTDTIRFKSKSENDYGNLVLRFTNLDLKKHPVLQVMKGSDIFKSIVLTGPSWSDQRFAPGEYTLRILIDQNANGKWDPGNYEKKIQPEKVILLDDKLNIKANWDNERDIQL